MRRKYARGCLGIIPCDKVVEAKILGGRWWSPLIIILEFSNIIVGLPSVVLASILHHSVLYGHPIIAEISPGYPVLQPTYDDKT